MRNNAFERITALAARARREPIRAAFTTLAAACLLWSSTAPSHAVTLFGDVSHSDVVPPADQHAAQVMRAQTVPLPPNLVQQQPVLAAPEVVPAPLQASVAQQQQAPTLERPAIEWFMIPNWMAGTWTKRGDLTTSIVDLRTGATQPANVWTDDAMTIKWGHQLDRQGHVWHANFIPSERDGSSDGELVRFVTVSRRCEVSSPQQLVTRTHYIVTEAYGNSNVVANRFQQETLCDYQPVSVNEFDSRSSNRMYTLSGQPTRGGSLDSKFVRTAEFVPIDSERGVNMLQALNAYLHSRGLDDLTRATPF